MDVGVFCCLGTQQHLAVQKDINAAGQPRPRGQLVGLLPHRGREHLWYPLSSGCLTLGHCCACLCCWLLLAKLREGDSFHLAYKGCGAGWGVVDVGDVCAPGCFSCCLEGFGKGERRGLSLQVWMWAGAAEKYLLVGMPVLEKRPGPF